MDYKQLDQKLLEEFAEQIEKLHPDMLKHAGAIRVLADISSVLLCLWHPATKAHFEKKTPFNETSYLQEGQHNPVGGY